MDEVGMITLRPYQEEFVGEVRAQFRAGKRAVLLQSPTGSGKGATAGFVVHNAVSKGNRVYIVAHRQEILEQLATHVHVAGLDHGYITADRGINNLHRIQVASIQTLARRLDMVPEPDLLILDECFPAGTIVGGKPIETLNPGDWVEGKNGLEQVVNCQRRAAKSMVRCHLIDGQSIECTANHPFWTNRGWVKASTLTSRDMVLTIMSDENDMFHVWERSELHKSMFIRCGKKTRTSVLLKRMPMEVSKRDFIGYNGEHESEICVRSDENPESNVQSRVQGKSKNDSSRNGMETADSRWERQANSGASNAFGINSWLGNGGCGSDPSASVFGLSALLQTGHCESPIKNWSGSGWIFSWANRSEISRPKKRTTSFWTRVDRVEVLQQTSDGTFGGVCPDGFVYNVETTGTHTYTANGILVHNCHHASANTYQTVIKRWQKTKILGLTATPCRLDGRGLNDIFEAMVLGPTVGWLISNGYLAKPVYYAPAKSVDLSGVHITAGDFNKHELEETFDKPTITGDAVAHYKKLAGDRQAICFCVSLAHSAHVVESFTAAGVRCEGIDGTMHRTRRRSVMDQFRVGETRVLVSVDLIGEGVDVPAVGAAILLRPTASLGLHLQQIGRALRIADGKPNAIILDHAGNLLRHGLAETEREWTLEGRKKGERRKKDEEPACRQCEKCFRIFDGDKCPECGTVREAKPREIEQRSGELRVLTPEEIQMLAKRKEVGRARSLAGLLAIEKARGYKPGWAQHVFASRNRRSAA